MKLTTVFFLYVPGCGVANNDFQMLAKLGGHFTDIETKRKNVFDFQDLKDHLGIFDKPSDPSRKASRRFVEIMFPEGKPGTRQTPLFL